MFAELRARELHQRYRPSFPVDVDLLCAREGIKVLPVSPEHLAPLDAISVNKGIVVARTLSPRLRRWTLAHEMHHVLADAFDQRVLYARDDPRADQLEHRAEAFVRELLMPGDELRRVFAEHWPLTAILRHFGVPLLLFLERCSYELLPGSRFHVSRWQ